MRPTRDRIGINPLQFMAAPDGWFRFDAGPSLEERLSAVAAAGFGAVHCDVPEGLSAAEYANMLAHIGLRPAPGYVALAWSADAEERGKVIERARSIAATHATLGLTSIFVALELSERDRRFLRPAVGSDASEERLRLLRDFVALAAGAIGGEGVKAALHPHVGTWIETESETRFVLDTTPPDTLWFGPDIGHLAWAGVDVLGIVASYRDRIPCLHLKDFHAEIAQRSRLGGIDYRGTVLGGLWTEPGRGDLDINGLFEALGPGPCPWIVVEVDRGSVPDAYESVRLCGEWLHGVSPA